MSGVDDPTVNILVSGDFKQLQLVPELAKTVRLGRVIYASRLSNSAARLQLSPSQARNLFLKEYLLQFHARYLNHAFADTIYPLYDKLWRKQAQAAWQPCDVLHAVIQGKSLSLFERAKAEGARILGHPIVSHPGFREREMRMELERLSLPAATFISNTREVLAEIALCDRLFCLSGLVKDTFVAAGFPAQKIDIIPLPTDLETFSPAPEWSPPQPFRVLCVAQLDPIKGHIYLLEAWKKLKLPNAELVLAGTLRNEMKPILKRYEGLFNYVGPLGRKDLVRLYRSGSVLVLPSVEDAFGLVVAEALACGVPAVVTEHVGAREIIAPGENGFVVPPRSPEALAEILARIHASHELQKTLHEGAIASRTKFPTVPETAGRLISAYRKTFSGEDD